MKIDEQNAQEKIMDDLLHNIHKEGMWLAIHRHVLNENGLKEHKEKIAKLTLLYNGIIQKREDKSNKLKSLYQPGEQSDEERQELYKLIEE